MQPWASLLAIGAKKFETRSRNWKYRGDFLIHASKEMNKDAKRLARTEIVLDAFTAAGITELPLGKIIGSAHISNSFPTAAADDFFFEDAALYPTKKMSKREMEIQWEINVKREKSFGDFTPGRFFYEILDPISFPILHHIPVKGNVILGWDFERRICMNCGCTDHNCRACIEKTGQPCGWIAPDLCSACKDSDKFRTR